MSVRREKLGVALDVMASASIRRKLTSIIMVVSAAALVGSGALIVISQMAVYRRSMQYEHLMQSRMIANNCLAAVSFMDPKDAGLILQTMSAKSALAYASVSLADGSILAEYRRQDFLEGAQAAPEMGETVFMGNWLLSRQPIVLDGTVIGSAFLQSDLRDLHHFRRQILTIVGSSLLVVLVVSWIVSFMLLKLISAPIERLTAVVREVSRQRDYSLRARGEGRDEIGVLARAFNEMLSEVELRDEQLRERMEHETEMQEQLARSERMESIVVLAGGVAHDLNNILGPMVMLPELIGQDLDTALQGDEAVQRDIVDSLDVMKVSAQRAASVVRELLALSRRGHYERVPCNLNALGCFRKDSGALRSLAAMRPDVTLTVSLAESVLMVLASEDHLCRVVDNLVRNAVEAIEGKGQVKVSTYAQHLAEARSGYVAIPAGDYAVIEIADSGTGIPEEHLRRVFEPFYTKKQKTDSSGSGLGLSVVHGIVDDHKGFVDVASEVGVGTTFWVYLPLTAAGSVETHVMQADDSYLSGTGRVLVVDDEPGQCFLARNCLMRLGYSVGIADEGRAAVEIYKASKDMGEEAPYDLIVLDMRMAPGFDGLDTMQAILALYPEQKVLIASGHAENDRSTAALDLGAKWLLKPYGMHELAKAVHDILQ